MRLRLILAAVSAVALLAACGAGDDRRDAEPAPVSVAIGATGALSPASINAAGWKAPPPPPPPPPQPQPATPPAPAQPDPLMIRAQILLDRAGFSPGVIDGLGGENTRQALEAYARANNLESGGELTAELFQRLTADDHSAATQVYAVTAQDVAGPFNGPPPPDLEAMSRLPRMGYADAAEALAERFHLTVDLLHALNPGVDLARAGQRIVVPAVGPRALSEVARIVVDKGAKTVMAYDAEDWLLAWYPATIGSSERPAPSGRLSVVGVANEPDYTYDPERVSYDRGDRRVVVPEGPNNPVGTVWIELSRDTYGIHGTPDPEKIGKTASNGCIRLTNWDAEALAAGVRPGVTVVFR